MIYRYDVRNEREVWYSGATPEDKGHLVATFISPWRAEKYCAQSNKRGNPENEQEV